MLVCKAHEFLNQGFLGSHIELYLLIVDRTNIQSATTLASEPNNRWYSRPEERHVGVVLKRIVLQICLVDVVVSHVAEGDWR